MQDYTAMKEVLSICRDAEQGFRGAANAVKTPALREIFEQYSMERADFANELTRAAHGLGLQIDNPSGIGGVIHAGWITLKGVLTGHNEHQILVETRRGEELSVKAYREALAMSLSEPVRALLEQQFERVQQAHDRIQSLCESTAPPPSPDQRTRQAH